MKPRITAIVLAVEDLEKSLAFYRDGLGLPTEGIVPTAPGADSSIVLFEMSGGLILTLYPKTELAKDAKLPVFVPSPAAFSMMHGVDSKEEVNAVMVQAKKAGATITDPAHDRGGGVYSGFFQDLDGHLWEVVWYEATE
jgi:catechol 2,3-dioxygenase-like lactoylglutathione lyase family enzyme